VVGGGPPSRPACRKGDLVTEIAGQKITNIYDYTSRSSLLKIGQPAAVVYVRDGKETEDDADHRAREG
jgi:S1-C subfamily serine protease